MIARSVQALQTWRYFRFAVVAALASLVYFVSSGFAHPTGYDNYTILANAWIHGHVWVPQPSPAIDAVVYDGKYYMVEAPMPALLMLPLVLIFGLDANQSLVCVLTGATAVAAADLLFGNMGIEPKLRNWLVVLTALGTGLWWNTAFGAVWMFAHVATVLFLTFALAEWYGKRRLWLVGLMFSCAALTRFPTILATIPFLYWALAATPSNRFAQVRSFVIGFAPLLCLEVLYNFARWNTPYDIGFTIFYHEDLSMGSPVGSPFGISHIPFNIYSWFFLAPQFFTQFPWLRPTPWGVALTFTSPALVLALGARLTLETIVHWTSALLVAIPALLYFTNGFEQFGMRHTLDFTPFLLCLVARGLQAYPNALGFSLIVVSVLENAYGVWYSWAYHAYAVVPRT